MPDSVKHNAACENNRSLNSQHLYVGAKNHKQIPLTKSLQVLQEHAQ